MTCRFGRGCGCVIVCVSYYFRFCWKLLYFQETYLVILESAAPLAKVFPSSCIPSIPLYIHHCKCNLFCTCVLYKLIPHTTTHQCIAFSYIDVSCSALSHISKEFMTTRSKCTGMDECVQEWSNPTGVFYKPLQKKGFFPPIRLLQVKLTVGNFLLLVTSCSWAGTLIFNHWHAN